MKLVPSDYLEIDALAYRDELFQAAHIAYQELRWASLREVADMLRVGLLKKLDKEFPYLLVPGIMSDFAWEIVGEKLVGYDDFGAHIVVGDGYFSVRTCGGHSLSLRMEPGNPYSKYHFRLSADDRPSKKSWGDYHTGLTGESLAEARAARIVKAIEW